MWMMSAILAFALILNVILNIRPYAVMPLLLIFIVAFTFSRRAYFKSHSKHILWLDLSYAGLFLLWTPGLTFMMLPNMASGNPFGIFLFGTIVFGALLFMVSSLFVNRPDEY